MTEKLMLSKEDELLELLDQGGESLTDHLLDEDLSLLGTQSMETIDALLQSLGEEEFAVVDKYFGLSGEGPYTADEIGDLIGLDESEVGEIVARALRQMRGAEL